MWIILTFGERKWRWQASFNFKRLTAIKFQPFLLQYTLVTQFVTSTRKVRISDCVNWAIRGSHSDKVYGQLKVFIPAIYSEAHLEQGVLKDTNNNLISCSAAERGGFVQESGLTEAKLDSLGHLDFEFLEWR